MKRNVIVGVAATVLIISTIIISAFRERNSEPLFYYAFNEKIPLQVVPGKFVIRYTNAAAGRASAGAGPGAASGTDRRIRFPIIGFGAAGACIPHCVTTGAIFA